VSVAAAPRAVLFDLDGTLLDTAPDMVGALNLLRVEEGMDPMPFEHLRFHVSHGAARLVAIGFGCGEGDRFESLRRRFLDLYRSRLCEATRLFDGLDEVLLELEGRDIPWGVVTNKPAWLTDPLIQAVGLGHRAGCVVSGDTLAERKPHPLPLLHAAQLLGVSAADCAYVGDAERDIQAGRAAGMRTLVAAFGYISAEEDPRAWMADDIVFEPAGLLAALALARRAVGPDAPART
jgi:phosphoglycolate phosphatase